MIFTFIWKSFAFNLKNERDDTIRTKFTWISFLILWIMFSCFYWNCLPWWHICYGQHRQGCNPARCQKCNSILSLNAGMLSCTCLSPCIPLYIHTLCLPPKPWRFWTQCLWMLCYDVSNLREFLIKHILIWCWVTRVKPMLCGSNCWFCPRISFRNVY